MCGLLPEEKPDGFRWGIGAWLRKKSGSQWQGHVVGFYSTGFTPEGYAIESDVHRHSVQIYPASALEEVPDD
jgi:hypothetical protein